MDKKFGIYSPITPIAKSLHSHRRGWAEYYKQKLEHLYK